MSDEKFRSTFYVSAFYLKYLKLWAYFQGKGVVTLVRDIIQARVEANLPLIKEMLESRAKDLGISEEELINKILSEKPEKPVIEKDD